MTKKVKLLDEIRQAQDKKTLKDDESFRASLASSKGASIAHLLIRTARLMNEAGLKRVQADPRYAGTRAAHLAVFPHLDLEGTRLTELARRMGVTKQAVSQVVDDLERLEAVERQPDPEDGRAKRVVFTDKGRAFMLEGLGVLQSLDAEALAEISPRRQQRLQEDLLKIMSALEALLAD